LVYLSLLLLCNPADVIPGTLCCEDAEEAKTLIPSLADKISDEDLQELLNEISKHRGYDR
jgi:hypothetical protein